MSNHPKWEVTRDRRDGKWIEGHGTEFPPIGHMDQPHESAIFNRLDLGQSYRYTNGAWVLEGSGPGAGLTVQEVDGVPSALAVDTVQFDQTDGFVLTDLGAGDVRLDLDAVPEARLALSFPTHSNANDPSAGQKAALAGTSGVPGVGNEYVTDDDPRNSDARTPLAHNHAAADVNSGRFSQARMPDAASGFLKAGGVGVDPAYAALVDGDIPAAIARDTEVSAAVSAHEAAADPHTGYQKESEKAAANGYASLDAGTLVPVAQIPTHDIITKHSGFPGGGTTFLRDDGTFASPGASSTNIKQTEIDFGATPVAEASFTITDADVTALSQLIGNVAYEAPTGKDLDELEMDGLDLKFGPGVGEFLLYARGQDGYVHDKFKINYLIG